MSPGISDIRERLTLSSAESDRMIVGATQVPMTTLSHF